MAVCENERPPAAARHTSPRSRRSSSSPLSFSSSSLSVSMPVPVSTSRSSSHINSHTGHHSLKHRSTTSTYAANNNTNRGTTATNNRPVLALSSVSGSRSNKRQAPTQLAEDEKQQKQKHRKTERDEDDNEVNKQARMNASAVSHASISPDPTPSIDLPHRSPSNSIITSTPHPPLSHASSSLESLLSSMVAAASSSLSTAAAAVPPLSRKASATLSRAERQLDSILHRCRTGKYAEEELTLIIKQDKQRNQPHYDRLRVRLREKKFDLFVANGDHATIQPSDTQPPSPTASSSSPSFIPLSSAAVNLLNTLPGCVLWHRRHSPSILNQLHHHAHTYVQSSRHRDESSYRSSLIAQLPPTPPVRCIVAVMSGMEFVALHACNELDATIEHWTTLCDTYYQQQHDSGADGSGSFLLLIHGLYELVQQQANAALAAKRTASATPPPASSSSSTADQTRAASSSRSPSNTGASRIHPRLKKLSDVDALLARLWFRSKGKMEYKMFDNAAEVGDWLVVLSDVMARAPYKDVDNVITLANTSRTDRMRGGDAFIHRLPSHDNGSDDDGSDDDNDDGRSASNNRPSSSSSLHVRRVAAKSTLGETWRLYLMQIPRLSERIALCITRSYPTMRSLWEAYQTCSSDKQRELMLQDLVVSGGSAAATSSSPHLPPTSRSVRIGPALSKAVYQSIYFPHANINHHTANNGSNVALTSLSPMHGMDPSVR